MKIHCLCLLLALTLLPVGCSPTSTQPVPKTPGLTVTSSATPPPTATLSPEAYFQQISRNWRVAWIDSTEEVVCAMDGDGSGKICQHTSEYIYGDADWSPDGRQLAIGAGHDLFVWTPGVGLDAILSAEDVFFYHPAWSPDGQYIAFMTDELRRSYSTTTAFDIFIRSLDGSVYGNMTINLAANNEEPDWSPDGQKLIFESSRLIDSPMPNYPGEKLLSDTEIVLVDIDDPTHPVHLTDNNEIWDMHPHWSPDGSWIAFISSPIGEYTNELFIMNPDGTGRQQVTYGFDFPEWIYNFTWLPDGKFILINEWLIELETGAGVQIRFSILSIHGPIWLMSTPFSALSPLPTPHCAYGWSQLYRGMYAVVTGDDTAPPNRVRSAPSITGEIILQIYPQTVVKVFEGPICADGLVFWRVENASIPGGSGWTAEGDGVEYWLEPYTP